MLDTVNVFSEQLIVLRILALNFVNCISMAKSDVLVFIPVDTSILASSLSTRNIMNSTSFRCVVQVASAQIRFSIPQYPRAQNLPS